MWVWCGVMVDGGGDSFHTGARRTLLLSQKTALADILYCTFHAKCHVCQHVRQQ